MHSSRMCTARSSSCLLGGVCLSACWDTPPGCGPGDPPGCGPGPSRCGLETSPQVWPGDSPQVWAWRPPWVWAWRPPQVWVWRPPWVWAWRPPRPDPSTSLLGVGLETCNACWDTTPSPVNRMTDRQV